MLIQRSGKMENTIALQGPIQCLWNFQLSTFNFQLSTRTRTLAARDALQSRKRSLAEVVRQSGLKAK
jgi:hypothetical protein